MRDQMVINQVGPDNQRDRYREVGRTHADGQKWINVYGLQDLAIEVINTLAYRMKQGDQLVITFEVNRHELGEPLPARSIAGGPNNE